MTSPHNRTIEQSNNRKILARGLLAGLLIVAALAAVLYVVLGRARTPSAPQPQPPKKPAAIKAVTPAPAPKTEDLKARPAPGKKGGTNDVRVASAKPRKFISKAHERYLERLQSGVRPRFDHISENILAMYAEPGVPVPPMPLTKNVLQDFANALVDKIKINDDDTEEDIRLKESVAGMKEEAREYIKAGGDIKGYLDELANRQKKECEYRQSAQSIVVEAVRAGKGEEAYETWKAFNKHLNEKGIKELTIHPELIKYQNADTAADTVAAPPATAPSVKESTPKN